MRQKKSFGQHFLRDKRIIERILSEVPQQSSLIVEVGPGEGALTHGLLQKTNNLILVEADRDLVPELKQLFPNVGIIEGDAARIDFASHAKEKDWVFVSNLPYNAAAAILANVIESEHPPEEMIVMVQKEQGDRIRAQAGDMGLLSVVVQLNYSVKRLFDVPRGAFSPPPNVDSSILRLKRKKDALMVQTYKKVVALAKQGFSSRRKQLQNNLGQLSSIESNDVKAALVELRYSKTSRAQELKIEDWIRLTEKLG